MAGNFGKALSKARKVANKAGVPGLVALGIPETLIHEGPKGLKTDLGAWAALEAGDKALKNPAVRSALGKAASGVIPPALALKAGVDTGRFLYHGGAALNEWNKAGKEKKKSEEKYGTVEAATRTRKRRQRAQRITADVRQQRENLIRQGLLEEGAVADFTDKQIEDEINRGMDPTDTSWMRKARKNKKNAGS